MTPEAAESHAYVSAQIDIATATSGGVVQAIGRVVSALYLAALQDAAHTEAGRSRWCSTAPAAAPNGVPSLSSGRSSSKTRTFW